MPPANPARFTPFSRGAGTGALASAELAEFKKSKCLCRGTGAIYVNFKGVNRALEAQMSREQELRLAVETIPALVWRAGPKGDIEYVNKRMLEYFGAPLDDIIGWGWAERVHPDDIEFKVETWLKNLESENPHDTACRFRGADGRYRWFAVRAEPLRADDGSVLSWYGVLIDIDDHRKAEEARRESEYEL